MLVLEAEPFQWIEVNDEFWPVGATGRNALMKKISPDEYEKVSGRDKGKRFKADKALRVFKKVK